MTEKASTEPVVVSGDGVTVEKSFDPDEFPVPAIVLEIENRREQSIELQLIDTVPEDAVADVGFHPEYGAEYWYTDETDLVFERELEPSETFVTVYGLREGDVERLLTEPTIGRVDPADDRDEGIVSAIKAVEEDVISEVELEDPSGEPRNGDTDVETPDLLDEDSDDPPAIEEPDDSQIDSPADASAEESDDTSEPELNDPPEPEGLTDAAVGESERSASDSTTDELVAALAEELRSGDVSESDLETLRAAVEPASSGSVEARLQRLQGRMADLDAYVDALEAFLDENGDARTLLSKLDDEIEAVDARVDALEEQLDDAIDDANSRTEKLAAAVESELGEMWEDLDVTRSRLADLEAGHESIETEFDSLRADTVTDSDVEELSDDIDRLDDQLDDLAEMRARLETAFGS